MNEPPLTSRLTVMRPSSQRKTPAAPFTKMASLDIASPAIVSALNEVSRVRRSHSYRWRAGAHVVRPQNELYNTVDELSNDFHTRLSISDGADDAAEYLQSRLVGLGARGPPAR